MPRPITLALVNDYDLIVNGVRALLADYQDQIRVVETDSDVEPVEAVDIALFDSFAMDTAPGSSAESLAQNPHVAKVVIYTWRLNPGAVELALKQGARGVLSKTLAAADLVKALVAIHEGDIVVSEQPAPDQPIPGSWPGKEFGLTAREAEVVSLIVAGLSNQEIAQQTYLSINSVKSYIRTAYRTMGVSSRSQAVLWGLDHGMRSQQVRRREPELRRTPLPTDAGVRRP